MVSVVIAAHNEESVIEACLAALHEQIIDVPLHLIVSANGCTDDTVNLARAMGATVIDRRTPGKAAALNAGDAAALTFPRIYLDADIVVPPHGVAALVAGLSDTCLATAPGRRFVVTGRAWPVRAYYSINERLPIFRDSLFGRGMIALSEAGRSRFDLFPELVADDLYVDSQFSGGERHVADNFEIMVEAPLTTRALVRRLVRVRRGNAQMRAAGASGEFRMTVRKADRWAWLTDVVRNDPRSVVDAVAYVAISMTAALLARRRVSSGQWERDDSTRRSQNPEGPPHSA